MIGAVRAQTTSVYGPATGTTITTTMTAKTDTVKTEGAKPSTQKPTIGTEDKGHRTTSPTTNTNGRTNAGTMVPHHTTKQAIGSRGKGAATAAAAEVHLWLS